MPKECEVENRSSYHLRARDLLRRIFGSQRVLEEVGLPSLNGLRFDFFIPSHHMAVEVHGSQHYEFSRFFHDNMWNFWRSQGNDQLKRDWCELNSIGLIELPYNEDDTEWTKRILKFKEL
jgi:hypothetical protein